MPIVHQLVSVRRMEVKMTKQKTPHTQTQQNVAPEQTDLEPNEETFVSGEPVNREIAGAETGQDRAFRKIQVRSNRKKVEPTTAAYEGPVTTRTPKRPVQGITSRSADEESERQQKVVNERPDAQAGVNHSK